MFDAAYRKRLAGDLLRWRDEGWVTTGGVDAILASLDGRRSTYGMATLAGTLGALLLGLGVIVFVGSNWEEIPRFWRFAALLACMAAAYAVAGALQSRGHRVFADAALLVAGLVFAASIALVGQTYHLSGDFADAILLFLVGALGAAVLAGSATMTVLALVAGGYWTWMVVGDPGSAPHWGGLVVVFIAGGIATWINSSFALVVAIVAFAFWLGADLVAVASLEQWPFAGPLAVLTGTASLAWAAGAVLASLKDWPRLGALGRALLVLGLVGLLLAVGWLQAAPAIGNWGGANSWLALSIGTTFAAGIVAALAWYLRRLSAFDAVAVVAFAVAAIGFAVWQPENGTAARLVGGVIVIAVAIWSTNLGQTARLRGAKGLGLTAFGLEILYLYVVTLGTMLDTALAFLVGGVLFIGLAYGLFRIDRRLAAGAAAGGKAAS